MELAIADFSNDEGFAFPAIPTLAKKARLSPRQVMRAITRLKHLGELLVLKNKGPHGVNLYRVLLSDNLSPGQIVTVTPVTGGSDIHVTDWVTPMSPNQSVEPSKNRHPLGENTFDVFWEAFPRKQGRGEAENAWRKLAPTPDLITKILTAIEQSKTSDQWTRDGGRFIPSPAKWLQACGWEDILPMAPITQKDCSFSNEPCTAKALPNSKYCERHGEVIKRVQQRNSSGHHTQHQTPRRFS